MSHFHSHIRSATKAIETLRAGEPLVHHLKNFFSADKKYGSKDRKAIASLCYLFFRFGKAFPQLETGERIVLSCFLQANKKDELLASLRPDLNEKAHLSLEKKLSFLKAEATDFFPFTNELSIKIDAEKFISSFLQQPNVFLRLRPGKEIKVIEKFTEAKINFMEISTSCLALLPATKAGDVVKLDKDAVVQDRSSQEVFNYLKSDDIFLPKDAVAWDCCAASGGKSILLHDMLHGHVQLTVSDIRENILHNLRNRFEDAGIKKYNSFIIDLTVENPKMPAEQFDIIICDAPCTGSGTWARTPEQLSFFNITDIESYAEKQKLISSAAVSKLKEGGLFFYITCSVFEKENDDVTDFLVKKNRLQLMQAEYIKGYDVLADTMYVAVLKK